MLSLKKKQPDQTNIVAKNGDRISVAFSFLWPILRRCKRLTADLFNGERQVPRHLGSILTLAFFGVIISYGLSYGGHSEHALKNMTTSAGFAIEKVKIVGNQEVSDLDILQNLGLDETSSLITFDLKRAHHGLLMMPWVKNVELRKIYPATLYVDVKESEPFAIWQQGSQLSFIDHKGKIIAPYYGGTHQHLPLFVGLGADEWAADIYQNLARWPHYQGQIKAYIRVSNRRWDLRLDNGITLNLPETDIDAAMRHFEQIDREQNLLGRDIAEIDLRLTDRVAIRLTQDAMERRTQALELRAKQLKKEQRI